MKQATVKKSWSGKEPMKDKPKEPQQELIPINIGNVNDGAMIDGFEIELQKALSNIADLNTPATATRAVRLELILKPHSDRIVIETEFKCSCKLAPIETHKSKVFLGRTSEGGARGLRCRSAPDVAVERARSRGSPETYRVPQGLVKPKLTPRRKQKR
jgi:hypothetical protein